MHKAIKMYLDNTPIKEIVENTGISRTRLYKEINMLDIKRGWNKETALTKLKKDKKSEVEYLVNLGMAQWKIGAYYGVSQTTVSTFMKKHGIKKEKK